ncbi:MAG: hypothetical protein Tsb009_38180 [Planctomycetaceae bacterium]
MHMTNNFLQKRDPWGHAMALWVLLGMIFLAPLGWWAVRQIKLENDVENWLPSDDPQSRILSWYRDQFPVEDRVLISWKGSNLNDPRVIALATKLEGKPDKSGVRRNGSPYVEHVVTPQEIIKRIRDASNDKVSLEEAIKRLEGVLIGPGMLKVKLTEAGKLRQKRVERTIRDLLEAELGITPEIHKQEIAFDENLQFPKGMTEEEIANLEEFPTAPEHDLQVFWPGMHSSKKTLERVKALLQNLRSPTSEKHPNGEAWVQSCFQFASTPVAVFVTLSEAGSEEPRDAMKAIRTAALEVGIPEEDLHLGGRPVASSELNQQVKHAAWNRAYPIWQLHKRSPILLSALVSVALAFVMLRNFRLATLVLIISNYTMFLAVALVPVTHGSMNMVLVVMPTLLSVLTTSAAIHVANYWKHAAERDLRTAVAETLKMARQPCMLASLTTAIGLASLISSPLLPVRDFGLYSAIGCLISLFMVLVCFPALLMFWPGKKPSHEEIEHTSWKSLAHFLVRFRIPITLVSLAGFAICAYGLKWFRTETKVIRYFPDHARVVQDYNFLEENLAGIVPVDVVVRFDSSAMESMNFLERLEVVRAVEQEVRNHPEISGTISLAAFQEVHKPLPENASIAKRAAYRAKIRGTEREVKENKAASSLVTISKDITNLEGSDGREISIKKGDELWRITAQVAIMSDLDYSELTEDLNARVASKLMLHEGADHVVTGMVPVFLRTQQAVLDSLIQSFALAFVLIALVMMIVLKHPISGLITMLPNLLPIGIVFGLISWAGIPVDIGTMITASVALGIAVDGTLHLLTWFRAGIADGMNRRDAISQALMHCGPAMWQTSAAVGIGLLMLYPADLLLIHRFGWLMAALIGAALLADIIFLPALLAGPLGTIIERSVKRYYISSRENSAENGAEQSAPAKDSAENPGSENPAVQTPHVLKLANNPKGKIYRVD